MIAELVMVGSADRGVIVFTRCGNLELDRILAGGAVGVENRLPQ